MLLHPSCNTNEDEENEAAQARSRGMLPLRFRLEMKVTYAERGEKFNAPIVASCERRGAIFATSPCDLREASQRVLFSDSIRLNMVVFRKETEDGSDLKIAEIVSNGKKLSGVEPVRARLTLREIEEGGVVVDVAAIDLANYIVGAHGLVKETIELQLGSVIELQVTSDLEGSSDVANTDSAKNQLSKASLSSSTVSSSSSPPRLELAGEKGETATAAVFAERNEDAEPARHDEGKNKPSNSVYKEDLVPINRIEETADFGGDGNTSLTIGEKECPTSPETIEDDFDFDSELDEYLLNSMYNNSPDEISSAGRKVPERSLSESGPIISMVSKRHTYPDSIERQDSADSGHGFESVKSRDSTTGPYINDLSEELASLRSEDSDPFGDMCNPFGDLEEDPPIEALSQAEKTDEEEEEEGSEFGEEQNRIVLPNHIFTPMVLSRSPTEPYVSVTDEGLWSETPVLTSIDCPFPISVWSIQGPEELDPDEEFDMMEMEDGTLVPRRNIPKLQSAAAALHADSTTKPSPPALPGNMSPLQRSFLAPTKVRQALYVALAKPLDMKKCTVLAASKTLYHNRVDVDDPPISDSEGEDEEEGEGEGEEDDDEHEEDEEDEAESDLSGNFMVNCTDMDLADSVGPTAIPSLSEESDKTRSASQVIRHTANQSAEMMNQINELEDETHSLKQSLKKSNVMVRDLQRERDILTKLLGEQAEEKLKLERSISERDEASVAAMDIEPNAFKYQTSETEAFASREGLEEELRVAGEARDSACHELEMLQAEVMQENNLRLENERLLNVILSLKRELDREPVVPDVLEELKQTKTELTLERGRAEALKNELAQLQKHGSPSSAKKSKGGFWGSNSKSKKKKSSASVISASESPRSVSVVEPTSE